MTTAKATPGPWVILSHHPTVDGRYWSVEHGTTTVATVDKETNARLIASAPTLLQTLKEMQARYFIHYGNDDLYDKATTAIADAT